VFSSGTFFVAFIKRVIAHPCFHNVGYKECETLLNNLGEGDCVIRPSSKVCQDISVF